jgi:lipopolysaccharide export system permease protein
MKKIDKYILSKYLKTFFFCLIMFTAIVVVVDLSEKTDNFVNPQLSVKKIIFDYYLAFIPHIDAMLFPLFVFLSVIFFTSKMAARSEIIAILSSGISFRRFLMPYIAGGLLLAILLWVGNLYFIPQANRQWADFEKTYINNKAIPTEQNASYRQNIYFRLDSNTYAGIKGYDTISKSGNGILIQKFSNNKLVYDLRAINFQWDTAKRNWKLFSVLERNIHPSNESLVFSQNKSVVYNFKPIDLKQDDYLKDQLTSSELNNFIKMEKLRGSEMLSTYEVEKYNRDALPFSVLILTVIGAVLASKKVRGGSGFHLALGVFISVMYILISRLTTVFATKGNFTPWLAAWLPNMIFGVLAIYFYKKAPK